MVQNGREKSVLTTGTEIFKNSGSSQERHTFHSPADEIRQMYAAVICFFTLQIYLQGVYKYNQKKNTRPKMQKKETFLFSADFYVSAVHIQYAEGFHFSAMEAKRT